MPARTEMLDPNSNLEKCAMCHRLMPAQMMYKTRIGTSYCNTEGATCLNLYLELEDDERPTNTPSLLAVA
jgi:hypothetical protein